MSLNKKLWFICKTGAASFTGPDLIPLPTELVYGESAKIKRKSNWLNVDCEDGYNGWIHSFYGLESRSKKHRSYHSVPCSDGLFNPHCLLAPELKLFLAHHQLTRNLEPRKWLRSLIIY